MKNKLKSIKLRIGKNFFNYSHQRQRPERAQAKWALIDELLPKEPGSLLDIGCNEGLFTINAARLGWNAWGIDYQEKTIKYATQDAQKHELENAFFSVGLLNLENSRKLPKFDVIIIVATFQEVWSRYGPEAGREIFRNLLNACNQRLIFEPASINCKYGSKVFGKDNDLASIEAWINDLTRQVPGWQASYVGKTENTENEPYRFMFLIEK